MKKFEKGLDRYQEIVPDQPGLGDYIGLWTTATNNLIEQKDNIMAGSEA